MERANSDINRSRDRGGVPILDDSMPVPPPPSLLQQEAPRGWPRMACARNGSRFPLAPTRRADAARDASHPIPRAAITVRSRRPETRKSGGSGDEPLRPAHRRLVNLAPIVWLWPFV